MSIDTVLTQSVRPTIYLWNNGGHFEHHGIHWAVHSSVNQICWPRWFMASMAETEYVCIMDDDITLNDTRVLEDVAGRMAGLPRRTIAGPEGVVLTDGASYEMSKHVRIRNGHLFGDIPCDIVKGMFMILRTEDLRKYVPLASPAYYREDDIAISALVAGRRRLGHLALGSMAGRFTVHDHNDGLWKLPGHFARRQEACTRFFDFPPPL